MIPREMFQDIMEKLLKHSRQDRVRWNDFNHESQFSVSFPESTLTIAFHTPETESDFYRIDLLNKERQLVDSIAVTSSDSLWPLAYDLYCEAARCATGWDKIVADVVKALDSGDRIGWPQTVPNHAHETPF